jgi:hypothetical protein
MKLTSLSKSVKSIGLVTLLSVMVSTTAQQSTQAQDIPPGFGVLALDNNGACVPQKLFYQEFKGITFSPEQKAAYRVIEGRLRATYEALSANIKTAPNGAMLWTPEQLAEGQQAGRDLEAQTMALLTPEQRPIYQANLALQRRIQACSEPIPFDRIMSSLPY